MIRDGTRLRRISSRTRDSLRPMGPPTHLARQLSTIEGGFSGIVLETLVLPLPRGSCTTYGNQSLIIARRDCDFQGGPTHPDRISYIR